VEDVVREKPAQQIRKLHEFIEREFARLAAVLIQNRRPGVLENRAPPRVSAMSFF
jgi:hypothetical protein